MDNYHFPLVYLNRIQIGSDQAPFLVNFFYILLWKKWLKEVKKHLLKPGLRFINDLKATNHGGKFEQSFEEKYSLELELKKERSGNWKTP